MPSFTTTTLAFLAAFTGSALAGPIGGLEARQFGGGSGLSTRNELVNSSGACKSTIVIFARGTTEPGNVGVVAGPSFFSSLSAKVGGDLLVQGVDYAANWPGAMSGGDRAGSQKMADLVAKAASQCPSSNIVISGYSQGAQLVHNAAALLPAGVASKISSAVVFGDPYNGQAVRGVPKVLSVCYSDDSICSRGRASDSGTGGHTAYGKDAAKAADFVVKNFIAPAPAQVPTTTTTTTSPVVAPTESTVEFPGVEDSFPIASPVIPTLLPTPTDITVEFPSAGDSFPIASPVVPTLLPTPTDVTVEFPSTEDSFPIASPVVPTLLPTPTGITVEFPSAEDSFPIFSPITPAPVPAPVESTVKFPSIEDSFPIASPVPVPAPAPAPVPVPGNGAGNGSALSIKEMIDRLLAAWGKGRPKGN